MDVQPDARIPGHEVVDVLIRQTLRDDSHLLVCPFARTIVGQLGRKFRLDLVDIRSFVLSNDPRERDQNNIPILTSGTDHDVIFLADSEGEFGRYVPYNTQQPRPVVGSEGLAASAWHWTLERYGAPQLNQRFRRIANRRMEGADFAAWVAVRSVVQAIVKSKTTQIDSLKDFLGSDDLSLDMYKGQAGGYRSWDNQLRQPILLHTFNSVIGIAPFEGFLHKTNHLDTLGSDAPESVCKIP